MQSLPAAFDHTHLPGLRLYANVTMSSPIAGPRFIHQQREDANHVFGPLHRSNRRFPPKADLDCGVQRDLQIAPNLLAEHIEIRFLHGNSALGVLAQATVSTTPQLIIRLTSWALSGPTTRHADLRTQATGVNRFTESF